MDDDGDMAEMYLTEKKRSKNGGKGITESHLQIK